METAPPTVAHELSRSAKQRSLEGESEGRMVTEPSSERQAAPVDVASLRRLLEEATPGPWPAWKGETGALQSKADAALIVAMHAALPQLLEACEKALWALEIAKYRLDGHMAYPGEPNSITEATALLKSLGFGVPGSLVDKIEP